MNRALGIDEIVLKLPTEKAAWLTQYPFDKTQVMKTVDSSTVKLLHVKVQLKGQQLSSSVSQYVAAELKACLCPIMMIH